uniref:Uncharacterized protein n=2 Tax=Rhodosorus marinus TaxID=101924 RepID=A0A7S2ZBS3_9RHOD|mmetsp:Transcript_13758/g.55153  ORF Transcript_13758/g.55153 Transcript_13758/m.55153 type:complete len:909 (+) Transcript_13758:344-3070(+)
MWTVNCTPVSEPELPSTHSHPLWQAWDYTVEQCLAQLPSMLAAEDASQEQSSPGFGTRGDPRGPREEGKIYSMDSDPQPLPEAFQYTPNTFFEDQMTAFEVWLAIGPEGDQPPEKLPIVLQVLLSQAHRLRALRLLSRFLQIGAWAINHALSVGIFPYVLKLLQSQIPELRRELVFIWGKLLALDTSCVLDLVKENGQVHFVDFLMNASAPPVCLAMSAFVLSVITAKFPDQLQDETVISACVGVLNHEHPLVRRWACLCFAKRIKSSNMSCQHIVLNSGIRQQLFDLARSDEACDVRTSALGVLMLLVSNLLASGNQMEQVKSDEDLATRAKQIAMEQMRVLEEVLALLAGIVENDASPLVRREIALGLEEAVTERKADFNALVESGSKESIASDAAQSIISILLILESDPHPIVSGITRRINSVVNFLGDKNNTQQERKDNTSAEAPKDNVFVSISHMLETVLNGKGNKHESRGNDLESVYNKVPFVSSGSPELVNCALEDMPSTYAIFCRSVLNLRYEGPGNLEPYIAEEKVGVKFTSARKQLFESDMKSRWAAEMEDKLPANLREVLNLRLGVGELWSSAFLPMDPMLVVGDALGVVSIWNTDTEALETQFGIPRADPQGICGITSLCVLEGNIESPIIAAGAGDGVASIWTRRGSKEEERIVSIWNASGSMEWSLASLNSEKHRTAHGLKMSWNPHRLQLVAAGCEGGVLRLWNVASEICGGSIRAFTGESVTALDTRISTCVVGGTSGTVSLVDLGMQEHGSSLIFGSSGTSNAHGSAVVAVQQQQINDHLTTVLSAERDGMVKLWDVRNPSQALMQSEPLMGELTDMVAHDTLPNVIVVSGRSEVKLIDSHGRTTRELQYHEGFLSQRLSPITSLSLHSRKPVLAVGCADSEVSLYECADF